MKQRLDMDRIARGLGAERRGKVASRPGYFGALALVAEVQVRFRADDPEQNPRRSRPSSR